MKNLWANFKMFACLTVLTGVVYPLVITGIAQLTMKQRADGGFLTSQGRIIGASLIAQKFEDPKYFWPRPSSVDYNPLPSGGSNLGPTSAVLKKMVEDRKASIMKSQEGINVAQIPSELLYASGSGLDPHLSPAGVHFQVGRIIQARGWDEKAATEAIVKLVSQLTEKRRLGFIGEPCINVLKLNLALDSLDVPKRIKLKN